VYFSEIQELEPSAGLLSSVPPATKGRVQQTAADIQRQLEVSSQKSMHSLIPYRCHYCTIAVINFLHILSYTSCPSVL